MQLDEITEHKNEFVLRCATRRTGSMEANNRVGEVGVQTHTRRKSNWEIGEKTHAEGRQGSNSCCCSDQIAFDLSDTQQILGICDASIFAGGRTDAVTAAVRDNLCFFKLASSN